MRRLISLNRWQRLVVTVAAILCIFYAYDLHDQGDSPGTAFIAGVALSLLAFTKPQEGEPYFPFMGGLRWLRKHWQGVSISAAVLGVIIILGQLLESQRQEAESRRYEITAKREAIADAKAAAESRRSAAIEEQKALAMQASAEKRRVSNISKCIKAENERLIAAFEDPSEWASVTKDKCERNNSLSMYDPAKRTGSQLPWYKPSGLK